MNSRIGVQPYLHGYSILSDIAMKIAITDYILYLKTPCSLLGMVSPEFGLDILLSYPCFDNLLQFELVFF